MIRKTAHWLLILLGFAAAAGGAAAWYLWVRSDEMVRDELRARLQEIAPACDLQIGRVRFDWDRSVTVRDFAVRAKGKDSPPALVVPEAVIRIDRDRFLNEQAVDVQVIQLIRPRLDLTRRPDGSWTVEDLMPFHLDPSIAVPEWQIEDATVRFRLEQEGGEPVVLTLQEADLRLVPSGRRQLIVRGLSDVADAGPLQVNGKIDLDGGAWSFNGSVSGLNTSGNIAGFALRSSERLRGQVADLSRKLRAVEDAILADDDTGPGVTPNVPVRTASQPRRTSPEVIEDFPSGPAARQAINSGPPSVAPGEPCDLSGLGLNAVVDVKFSLNRPDGSHRPDYQVWVKCQDGQVVNTLLPFALRHLRGELYWDNGNLRLTELHADGGGTSLNIDGAFRVDGPTPAGTISVGVTGLVVSDRYPGKLPPAVERFLQVVRPSGPIDLAGTFDRDDEGRWVVNTFKLTARGASAVPEPFPYPIQDINGVLEQTAPGHLEGHMTGKAGVRPVALIAAIDNPGPEAEVGIDITAASAVVDEGVREAFKPDVRATLKSLGLEGIAENLHVRLYRPAGLGQKYHWWLTTKIRDGELEYERFPFRITQLAGEVSFDSDHETLTLRNVVGAHDRAVLKGEGSYRKPPLTPVANDPAATAYGLNLRIEAERVGLGGDLRAALPAELKHVWEELQPGGLANVTALVRWVPGGQPDIRMPRLDMVDGSLRPAAFPYPLGTVSAHLRYAPGRVDILDFVGWHHDGTRIAAEEGAFTFQSDGVWLLRLGKVEATEMRVEGDFNQAAPAGLRHILQTLDLRGPEGRGPIEKLTGRLDVSGSRRSDQVTAGWNLTAQLTDASFRAGLQVSHASGAVQCEGQHGGSNDWTRGTIGLSQADILGQRLTKVLGPFAYENGELVVGTREALGGGRNAATEPTAVPPDRRMRAICLGDGLLTLDSVARPGEGERYEGRVTLTGGRLEYLASNRGGMRNVAGVMNGWINFWGAGQDPSRLEGTGQVKVSPAALYELPVLMQVLKQLTTLAPGAMRDNTAFNSAQADFRIANGGFEAVRPYGGIVLAGDALRLIGGGRIDFDGRVFLQFYTTPPRNPGRILPVVGDLLNVAATGWLGVEVRGTTDNPDVKTVPLKALDDGWRTFWDQLGPLNPARTAGPLPRPRR